MAIVISRDGECIAMPALDEQTQKQMRLAARYGLHPETITEAVAQYQREHNGDHLKEIIDNAEDEPNEEE